MTKRLALLALSILPIAAWSPTDADQNNPQRFQTHQSDGETTSIYRNNATGHWQADTPTGTYGCAYVAATRTFSCP